MSSNGTGMVWVSAERGPTHLIHFFFHAWTLRSRFPSCIQPGHFMRRPLCKVLLHAWRTLWWLMCQTHRAPQSLWDPRTPIRLTICSTHVDLARSKYIKHKWSLHIFVLANQYNMQCHLYCATCMGHVFPGQPVTDLENYMVSLEKKQQAITKMIEKLATSSEDLAKK